MCFNTRGTSRHRDCVRHILYVIMQRVRNTVVELYELLSSFIVCNIKTIESSKLKNMRFYTYKRSLICEFLTKKIFSAVLSLLGTKLK